MVASFQGALALFKMILFMFIPGALVALARGGPAFVLLFYVGAVLVLYSTVLFAIALLPACGGGAALYLSSVSL